MKVIGISGKAGSGKDTAYLLLKEELESRGLKCTKLSFASKLKDVCTLLFRWDREQLESDFAYKEGGLGLNGPDDLLDPACEMLGKTRRTVMQEVGTEAMRKGLHEDVWIIALKLAIQNGEYDDYDVGFVTDCRFMNELNFVRSLGGTLIQVIRSGDTGTLTANTQHASELEWTEWGDWDIMVQNTIDTTLSPEENLQEYKRRIVTQYDWYLDEGPNQPSIQAVG